MVINSTVQSADLLDSLGLLGAKICLVTFPYLSPELFTIHPNILHILHISSHSLDYLLKFSGPRYIAMMMCLINHGDERGNAGVILIFKLHPIIL